MKRTIFAASCAILAAFVLNSCQKENKSVVELARELTTELQAITDVASANSHAARVAVLNKRFENAKVRVFALNDTALQRSAEDDADSIGSDYAAATKALAREIGRVRASFPASASDGDVDQDRLLIAIAEAQGVKGTPDELKEAGRRYMQDTNTPHETPGTFPEYYGSDKLREALSYRASVTQVNNMKFDGAEDVPAVPAISQEPQDAPTGTTSADGEGESSSGDDEDGEEL